MAKVNLKPSTLALRQGETADNTKGVRTRWLLIASESNAGVISIGRSLTHFISFVLVFDSFHNTTINIWFEMLNSFLLVLGCLLVHMKTKVELWIRLRKKLLEQQWSPGNMERYCTFGTWSIYVLVTLFFLVGDQLSMTKYLKLFFVLKTKCWMCSNLHACFETKQFTIRCLPVKPFHAWQQTWIRMIAYHNLFNTVCFHVSVLQCLALWDWSEIPVTLRCIQSSWIWPTKEPAGNISFILDSSCSICTSCSVMLCCSLRIIIKHRCNYVE